MASSERAVVAAVAAGGVVGALARYGIGLAVPAPAGGFPWATFWINVGGCAAIGALLVLSTEIWSPHRLVRPLLATGVLGGFTTFSAYALEARALLAGGSAGLGVAYLTGTVLAALPAVQAGSAGVRWLARRGREQR